MSLKRKASFPPTATPNLAPVVAGPSVVMDDAPQHLHSRTRKRFRDDRPDEKTVYENTLRWLFTAQQRQTPTPGIDNIEVDENMDSEALPTSEPGPTPETEAVDPRQQSLFKFFKPSNNNTPSSSHHTSRPPDGRLPDNRVLQPYSLNMHSPIASVGSNETHSPSSRTTGTDMDMDMDMDSGSD